MTISRRGFVGGALGFAAAGGSQLVATENSDAQQRVPPWKKGEFQIHFIHTGVGESQFLIFPDGTTMLLDCPGNPAVYLGRVGVPILPSARLSKRAGETILSANAAGAVSYRWTRNGEAITGGEDGDLTVEWEKAKTGTVETYAVVPIYDICGNTSEGAPLTATVEHLSVGTLLLFR